MSWGGQLDAHALLIFRRIQKFYHTFILLAAFVSGISIGAMSILSACPSETLSQTSQALLCSSVITALLSAVTATLLLFFYEGLEKATRTDLAVAWSPLALLDVSIVEFLTGVVCYYCGSKGAWRSLMAAQLVGQLGLCIVLSIWVWFRSLSMSGWQEKERGRPRSNRNRD